MKSERFDVVRGMWRLPLVVALAVSLVPVMPDLACGAPAGSIAGRVTADGRPWGGTYVVVYQRVDGDGAPDLERAGSTYAGVDGTYEIGSLAPGDYQVGFFDWATGLYADQYWRGAPDIGSAQDVPVEAGGCTGGIDADLGGIGSVSGRVTGAEGPVPGISVVGFIRAEDVNGVRWDLVAWANTDASGEYRLQGLRAGTYHVGFYDWRPDRRYTAEFWEEASDASDATDIELAAAGSVTDVDASLEEGGEISGVVGSAECEIGAITVDAYTRGEGGAWTLVRRAETGLGGSYRLSGLPSGTYRVAFSDRRAGVYATEYWNDAATLDGAIDIEVVAGSVRDGVDATLVKVGSPLANVTFSQLAGADRYATALEIARCTYTSGSKDAVVLATGRKYPDALSAAALAGAASAPILLVDGSATAASNALLLEIGRLTAGQPSVTVYVMGGPMAVSKGVENSLSRAFPGARIVRAAGATRYDTAVEAARLVRSIEGGSLERAFVVSGKGYTDALLAGPVAYARRWPILLTDGTRSGDARIMDIADEVWITSAYVIGDESAVPAESIAVLDDHFAHDVVRIAGATEPCARSVQVAEWGVRQGLTSWSKVGVASAERFPDALAAAPCLGNNGAALLLTGSTTLDPAVASALSANKGAITCVRYFGGSLAVPLEVRSQIQSLLQ